MSRPDPDPIALQSWHYPTNTPIQNDQFGIVENCLDCNSLIVINDGQTRSFVGHVLMYNYGRWFPSNAKIVFITMNKNRLSTEMELFRGNVECNADDIVELSGGMIPSMRETLWRNKRFFFVTPQVIYSDLINGSCPVNQIVLLVIDDAHLAVGRHAYCEIIALLRKSHENQRFRMVGLSPMVYSSVPEIRTVVDSLKISTVQFNADDSSDSPIMCKRLVEPTELFSKVKVIIRNDIIGTQIQSLIQLIPTWDINVETFELVQLGKLRQCYLVDVSVCKSNGDVEGCLDVLEALLQCEKTLVSIGIEALWNALTLLNFPMKETSKAKLKQELEKSGAYHHMKDLIQSERYKAGFCSNPKLAWLEKHLVEHMRAASGDKIIVVSGHQENSVQLLSALRNHSPIVKPMLGLQNPTPKQQFESFKTFLNGGYNVFILSSIDAEGIEACKANSVFFLEVPQQYTASAMMIGSGGDSSVSKVVFAVFKGDEEDRFNSFQERKAVVENTLANPGKLISLHLNHWTILPSPPVCIKRIFSIQQIKKNPETKKRKTAVVNSIAGFEKITGEMIAASPDLNLNLSDSVGCWFLVRHSRRIEDLDLILKGFDQNPLEPTLAFNDRKVFRLDMFMLNWRKNIDAIDVKEFLKQSRKLLCDDEAKIVEAPIPAVPDMGMDCNIEELPDAFFDESCDILSPVKDDLPAKCVAPFLQPAACASEDQIDPSPLIFQGKNTRVCYSLVKTTQVDQTPGNARRFFLDTQAGISGSEISDSEQNLSTVGSFICSGETEDDNSPDSQMLGFYRQSLFQSQPWAGFKDGALAYKSEPTKKKSKLVPVTVVEISESSSDDFLEGSDLDWDAIENNIL